MAITDQDTWDDRATDDTEALAREISGRQAFECMLSASLRAAVVAAGLLVLGDGVAAVVAGSLGTRWITLAVGGVTAAFAVFLGGFAGTVVVMMPLFRALEQAKIRSPFPYAAAALALNAVTYCALTGGAPDFSTFDSILCVAPGGIAAFFFSRDMAVRWRREAPAAPTNVIRLH